MLAKLGANAAFDVELMVEPVNRLYLSEERLQCGRITLPELRPYKLEQFTIRSSESVGIDPLCLSEEVGVERRGYSSLTSARGAPRRASTQHHDGGEILINS
jgi:hypothetical protein